MILIISWLVYGLIVGIVAKTIVAITLEEKTTPGLIPTILIGVLGSYVGGLFSFLLSAGKEPFAPAHILMGIGGAVAALISIHFFPELIEKVNGSKR